MDLSYVPQYTIQNTNVPIVWCIVGYGTGALLDWSMARAGALGQWAT